MVVNQTAWNEHRFAKTSPATTEKVSRYRLCIQPRQVNKLALPCFENGFHLYYIQEWQRIIVELLPIQLHF